MTIIDEFAPHKNDDEDGSVISSVIDDSDKSHTNHEEDGEEEAEKVVIAKAENKAVWWIRLLVILVLVLSALGVALAVYYYTSNAEVSEFEDQFSDQATKVFESIGSTLDHILGAVDAFNAVLVSYARFSNSTWPFVTLPDHAVHAGKLLSLSKGFIVATYVIVSEEKVEAWNNYSVANDAWVDEGLEIQSRNENFQGVQLTEYAILDYVHDSWAEPVSRPGPYYVNWQTSPVVPFYEPYNWDLGSEPASLETAREAATSKRCLINSAPNIALDPSNPDHVFVAEGAVEWASAFTPPDRDATEPFTDVLVPVIDTAVDAVSTVNGHPDTGIGSAVSLTALSFFFRDVISDILPPHSVGINVVFDNTCGTIFTYEINGPNTRYLGVGDLHDTKYDYLGQEALVSELGVFQLRDRTYTGLPLSEDFCPYSLGVYPSKTTEDLYTSNNPVIYTVVSILVFAFTSFVFLLYDFLVERRQKKVMTTAVQSSAIVSSIYPSIVRDRLFAKDTPDPKKAADKKADAFKVNGQNKNGLKYFLSDKGNTARTEGATESTNQAPIAEYFTATTVMFADVAGFTAWSSRREPVQVFTLLENLYGAFDRAAKRRRVFKVETIGDCYVAVTGLPEPRKDHATVMAKFAKECRDTLNRKVRELQAELGPDTVDLKLRTGLHSGPVIAGVLRGEKARFQLFGDTVNTAARMESNGAKDKIHVSQSTADALIASGKEHWITARSSLVEAKGKGQMQTYWVEPKTNTKSQDTATSASDSLGFYASEGECDELPAAEENHLVTWFTGVLSKPLQRVLLARGGNSMGPGIVGGFKAEEVGLSRGHGGAILDEVKEIIPFPDAAMPLTVESPSLVEIDSIVMHQLHDYVASVESMYNEDRAFHSFEHAAHVAASVEHFLSQIEAAARLEESTSSVVGGGMAFDPLAQFACLFSALIHNADHPGVSNAQLAVEDDELARLYKGKSIAEQKSMGMAWDLFLTDGFQELRQAICGSEAHRFRQMVINCVMATDVVDPDLKAIRSIRWDRAFKEEAAGSMAVSRKTTVIMEHIMQASVCAHTMQHWETYRKWNERFFEECYLSYRAGRVKEDPSTLWFLGESGFFDNFVLPLAKKLQDCGVLGASGSELLDSAHMNRQEWEMRGQDIVKEMANRVKEKGQTL